ncbi:MAG: VOC family protein [Gammaproteobacteria bacterium]|nr:VOC family protein [Gammaproteobacteria bacterium]MDH3374350.1 VOC family protein [Gammaproteobacteria bacterium]MDH3409915.1 VOC family protein [Gammaproteobacteria bacterium]MDH3551271.1 VOC family protein [Gammaproteobacteria bacterium]
MSGSDEVGRIGWIDMTVDDAPGVRDFYKAVVGWETDDVDMGDYSDYVMKMPSSGDGVAGVCHARGSNADLPSGWLIYIVVADVEKSAAVCTANGGKVIVEPRGLAGGQFCVVEDPGGSIAGLYQP